jgi:hypothetical protein
VTRAYFEGAAVVVFQKRDAPEDGRRHMVLRDGDQAPDFRVLKDDGENVRLDD